MSFDAHGIDLANDPDDRPEMLFRMFCRPWQVDHEGSSDWKKRDAFSALAAKSTASLTRPWSV